jgi:hypothetical protein
MTVVCVQDALVVICTSNTTPSPSEVASTKKRAGTVCALRVHVTVVVIDAALGHIRTSYAATRVAPVTYAGE